MTSHTVLTTLTPDVLDAVNNLAFNPDGATLATADGDTTLP